MSLRVCRALLRADTPYSSASTPCFVAYKWLMCRRVLRHQARASQAGLRQLRSNRAVTSSQPSHRTRPACPRRAGTRVGSKVRTPCPPYRQSVIYARGHGVGARPAGQLGVRGQRAAAALRRRQAARRRYPVACACTGQRQDAHGAPVDLCAR